MVEDEGIAEVEVTKITFSKKILIPSTQTEAGAEAVAVRNPKTKVIPNTLKKEKLKERCTKVGGVKGSISQTNLENKRRCGARKWIITREKLIIQRI